MMTKALVVGGTGYVGRELVRQLLDRKNEVSVLSRGQPIKEVEWLRADMADKESLLSKLEGKSYDVVYHVASLANDTGNPEEMIKVNIVGLTNMLEFVRKSRVKRFVLSSSVSAYGWYPATKFQKPLYMPVDENHAVRPKDMYCATKRMQEILALTFYHQYKVPVTILRLCGVVGPVGPQEAGGGRMWKSLSLQMKKGKEIHLPLFAPEEKGHFVDNRDVAAMHILVGEHPRATGEIFNCCGPKATTGKEFAALVEEIIPTANVKFGYPWGVAQGVIEFDMSKMERLLGYRPHYTISDSLRFIFDWVNKGGLENMK